MSEKEKEFYRRVKKYRVDPSGGSAANPVPGSFSPPRLCLVEANLPRLLWRENRQRGWIPAMAERSTSFQ